jgi:hypothetical protein
LIFLIPFNYEVIIESVDEIVEFIYNDVNETADPINWDVNDVHFSFYKWIETK